MAEINFNNLYDQLGLLDQKFYDSTFKNTYDPNKSQPTLEMKPAYDQMKAVYEAEQQVPESSFLSMLNPFSSASAAEVDLSNRGMPVANDGSIGVEDLTNPNVRNFLISAANALPNQSGIINALPNIMSPGVTTIENQAMRNFEQPYNMRDVAGESLPFNIDNLGNPNNDPRVVSEELGMTGFGRPTMADIAGMDLPQGMPSQYDQSAVDGYEDLIQNPLDNPNRLQNIERNIDIENEEFEEIPGFNFIDAPTSLRSRLKNLEYINNPRRGFIDNTLLARGNPNAGLLNRGKDGILSLLSRIPTPFNLARRGLDAITGPRRETTGTVYSDSGRAYSPSELNKMNAKGGYYSEPAREQRRREKRVENMLARKAAGKSYSQKNLNKLTTGGSKPGTYTTPGSGNAGSSSSGKVVCTMMNERYGFGSFRNKIWMKFHEHHGPEYQKGSTQYSYH